jgi:NADH dehydrogenase
MQTPTKQQVVILGGGFAGFYAGLAFERMLRRRTDVEVTIVDRENFFLFTPMLHEVAAGDLTPQAIVCPLRKVFRQVNFFKGDIHSIDLPEQKVHLLYGESCEHKATLHYDHLLLGLGSVTNFFNLEGLRENALTMKTLGDAIYLREHLIAKLEEADLEVYANQRKRKLTFVVAGGGFAGVETLAAINDFIRDSIKYYRHLNEDMVRVVLIHGHDPVLPEFPADLGHYTQNKLKERKVEVITNCEVRSFKDGYVQLSNQPPIECDTLIWTAGVTPSPAISKLDLPKEHGRIVVNHYLQCSDHAIVWAAGDCAQISDPHTGKAYPPTAQHALREGRVVAENIMAAIDAKPLQVFSYKTMGMMAAIGRRTGVANAFGLKFSGYVGWVMWRTVYLAKLPGFDRQVRVGFQWLIDLLFPPDLAQYASTRARVADSDADGHPLTLHGGAQPVLPAQAEAGKSRR